MIELFEQLPGWLQIVVLLFLGIGGRDLIAFLYGKYFSRNKDKAELDSIHLSNSQAYLERIESGTKLIDTLRTKLEEAGTAKMESDRELTATRIMLQVEARDNERLRVDQQKFWMQEGGCLERERILTEKVREQDRQHKASIAALTLDHQNQIDDIRIQLEEALRYKEKNAELAEENARLMAAAQ